MSKPLVFISHISTEKEVAIAFKQLIEESFLGMIEVFVSSDEKSIPMGQRWLESITSALKKCSVEVVLCSPQSVVRPWINFEAGAGWIRDIPVIPLCHSGMTPSNLPVPLNLLQAAQATEISSLNLIFPVLAAAIGSKIPKPDLDDFVFKVQEFEKRYTFWDACNYAFKQLDAFNREIIPILKAGKSPNFDLTETQIKGLEDIAKLLPANDIIQIRRLGRSQTTATRTTYGCAIAPLKRLAEVLADPHFHI